MIKELVNTFEKLNLKYDFVKLLLIGDYKNENDAISYKSQQIIIQSDIQNFKKLFVLPSYREGLPNVLIEAGSYGIPLLATNINGCNEVIIHKLNGLLVNKKDEVDLFNAIEKFIKDKYFYNTVKDNVRKNIVNRYSQDYFYKELNKITESEK